MTQLGDFHFKDSGGPDDDVRLRNQLIGVAVVVILLFVGGLYWFLSGPEEVPVETAVEAPPPVRRSPPPPPPVEEPSVEAIELPPLTSSDELVRQLASTLTSHPGLASWLVTDRLIQRGVAFVDSIAEGNNPTQHVPFMRPGARFAAMGGEPVYRVDPESYHRYDVQAQIIESLDADGVAALYRDLEPLLDEAYAELGYPDTPFRQSLRRAIRHLLETPIVPGTPELVRRGPFYHFTDESLESLSPAQKQFLAMGPDNVRRVQQELRSVARALDIRVP